MVLHEAQIQLNKGDSVQQQSPSEPIGASREGDTTTSTERTTQQEREIGKEINLLCRPWLLRRTKLARKVALKQRQGMTGVSGVGGVGLVLCAERSCTYPWTHPPTPPYSRAAPPPPPPLGMLPVWSCSLSTLTTWSPRPGPLAMRLMIHAMTVIGPPYGQKDR